MTTRHPALNKILSFCLLLVFLTAAESLTQVKRFTLLSTSDEHSTLVPLPLTDYRYGSAGNAMGGFARLSTLVAGIRAGKPAEQVFLFSSGDILGGTPFAWLSLEGYSPEIELMKKTGYDAITIGNHEFDYGPELLAEYFLRAGYPAFNEELPVIASNLVIPPEHDLIRVGIRESALFDLSEGVTLGVFGLLGKAAYDVAGFAEPVGVADQHKVAAAQVRALREAGADIIVALTHSGIAEDRELANRLEGIDIILGGHDHYLTPRPEIINKTIIFHSGHNLEHLGKLEFEWNSSTRELFLANERNNTPYHIPVDSSIGEDPQIRELTDRYMEKLNEFIASHSGGMFDDAGAYVIQSDFAVRMGLPFTESPVGNFVTDAMRLMAEKVTGERVDVAFQGNGVIRADIVPGTMEWSAGKVSFFDLVTVSGLGSGPDGRAGYPLVSLYLTGKEISNILEISSLLSQLMGDIYFLQVSGLRFRHDPGKALWLKVPLLNIPVPAYRSVTDVEIYAGTGIQDDLNYVKLETDDERLYHVVTDYYLTTFLPMVGEILPRLKLVLKDRNGNQVEPGEALISSHGGEFKVWEAVALYAGSFSAGTDDLPVMPGYYSATRDRITRESGIPLKIWSFITLSLVLILIVLLVRYGVIKIRKIIYPRNS
jgi:5'-nucleotidase / UDP-sugar diphosphatase